MKCGGHVFGKDPERIDAYTRSHAAIWPERAAAIAAVGRTNSSILLHGTTRFASVEDTGPEADDEERMAPMAASSGTAPSCIPTVEHVVLGDAPTPPARGRTMRHSVLKEHDCCLEIISC
jgi:L-rhamnose mutarotase